MSVFNTDEMDGEEAAFNAAEMDKQRINEDKYALLEIARTGHPLKAK